MTTTKMTTMFTELRAVSHEAAALPNHPIQRTADRERLGVIDAALY
jgi:hypothetical protein